MFDYHFPNIVICAAGDPKVVIFPYNDDEQFASDPMYKDLPKKAGSVTTIPTGDGRMVFVYFKGDKLVDALLPALKAEDGDVSVNLKAVPFDTAEMVAGLMFGLRTPWSLKTDKKEVKDRNIYLVMKDPKGHDDRQGKALATVKAFTEQLVNMPANYLTPTKFGDYAKIFADEFKLPNIKIDIKGRDYLEKEGMGSFLGVAKGSAQEPQLITITYKGGAKDEKPVVFVGKGLTFDSGGISIKPSNGMEAMKGDMAGAASAIAAVFYAAMMDLPLNIVTVAACCENMPSGHAVKPGDVLKAMNGTTIEVIDTDAEGRLVLADALLYAQKFEGRYTIDLATLTGACIVALGHNHTGMFTHDRKLAKKLTKAGLKAKDPVWQLPLDESHEDMLDSKVADISNLCRGKGAGSTGGAVFLQRFAPKEGWCHLDIAGVSANGGVATTRPVDMLAAFLNKLAK